MEIEKLVSTVIGLAIKIHTQVGPGCYENVYEEILYYELQKMGITVHRQCLLPIQYEDLYIEIYITSLKVTSN